MCAYATVPRAVQSKYLKVSLLLKCKDARGAHMGVAHTY